MFKKIERAVLKMAIISKIIDREVKKNLQLNKQVNKGGCNYVRNSF